MRVIAGGAKGTKLASLAGFSTRPTADRVKEALFNILAPYLPKADFLDLFAGNGGIGIEALSRGAASAVFIDSNPASVSVINRNLKKTRLSGGEVFRSDTLRALQRLHRQKRHFDIIFFDPPYQQGLFTQTLSTLDQWPLLNKGGIIIGEASKKEETSWDMLKFCLTDERFYGKTKLNFFKYKEDK